MPNNVERLKFINVDISTEIYCGLAVHHIWASAKGVLTS